MNEVTRSIHRGVLCGFDYLSQKLIEEGATNASVYFLVSYILGTLDKDFATIVSACLYEVQVTVSLLGMGQT